MSSVHTDPLELAEESLARNVPVSLATVVRTWGSAPRQSGSHMAVRGDGNFAGSVSGGCVEASVIQTAIDAMRDGKVRHLEFGITDDTAWNVGLACGGRISILVEPLSGPAAHAMIASLNSARRSGQTIARAVHLTSGASELVDPELPSSVVGRVSAEAMRHAHSQLVEIERQSWFIRVYSPPVDLVIVGAVHIAQALAKLAAILGYRVRVVDPRSAFATAERFPDIELIETFPEHIASSLTSRSAVVVLSHDPKIDDPALEAVLRSTAFYVGALGSKRTHASRLERLAARGLSTEALARIRGPVGLAIGAKTPEEIALSILAEITQVLRVPS